MFARLAFIICLASFPSGLWAQPPQAHVDAQPVPSLPQDARLGPLKDLNGEFLFHPPATKAAWESRAEELRRRVLVATGLWPLPERTPLQPVIHGKIQRDGFTVEKVYFESFPNHYVTGLLFRPDDGETKKRPVVLCPHGHGGRLQDYGADKIRELIAEGAERWEASGRYPKLARCASLARMGCTTFIFDMLGYADSQQISYELAHRHAKGRPELEGPERWGLFSAQAELRLQSVMGVQTWNSIRCLDFLLQLPEADPSRVGVTGGSGGGTQTILLCAIDDRPTVAFPNGMVSTSMQGGCTCENCSLLRVGTGNVELAALFAPKPQGMTAADDWTRNMMADGYPALQQVYALYGKKEDVACYDLTHFPHNYNYVSRAKMYAWFRRHLQLDDGAPLFLEEDFQPLTASETTVWDAEHEAPEGGESYEVSMTKYLAEQSDQAIASLVPTDASSLETYRHVVGGAWETMVGRNCPEPTDTVWQKTLEEQRDGLLYFEGSVRLKTFGEELPVISLFPKQDWNGEVVIWLDDAGKQSLFREPGVFSAEAKSLVDEGFAVLAADLYMQGDFLASDAAEGDTLRQRVVENPREAAAYTFGYNHALMAQRIHDVMTLITHAKGFEPETPERIHLLASGNSAIAALAARALSGDAVDRCAVLSPGFRFADIRDYRHPCFLPGAVKYGDVPSLMALNAPLATWVGQETAASAATAVACYRAAGNERKLVLADEAGKQAAIAWLTAR